MRRILPSHWLRLSALSLRVARRAAVTSADVQHLVGPELELPAVVVGIRLVEGEHLATCRRVEGAVGRDGVLVDLGVAVVVGVVDVGQGAARIDRQAEQASLSAGTRAVGHVECGCARLAIVHHHDEPVLLHDVRRSVARPPRCRHRLAERAQLGEVHRRVACRTAGGAARPSLPAARCRRSAAVATAGCVPVATVVVALASELGAKGVATSAVLNVTAG